MQAVEARREGAVGRAQAFKRAQGANHLMAPVAARKLRAEVAKVGCLSDRTGKDYDVRHDSQEGLFNLSHLCLCCLNMLKLATPRVHSVRFCASPLGVLRFNSNW